MYAIRVTENTANQVSSRTQLVRSDSNLVGFFIEDIKMKPRNKQMWALVENGTLPALYDSGFSLDELAKSYSFNTSTLWRYFVAAGIIMRNRYEAGILGGKKVSVKYRGAKHWGWKGGRTKTGDGYIQITKQGKRIYEHRSIMEDMLGRPLKQRELVHHKNGIRDDNHPSNLVLIVENKNWHPQICPKCGFDFCIK